MQDHMSRNDDPNDYVVHDPLLEKGKEKFNRMQAKQKRREREWAGRPLTWSRLCQQVRLVKIELNGIDELGHMPIWLCYVVWLWHRYGC